MENEHLENEYLPWCSKHWSSIGNLTGAGNEVVAKSLQAKYSVRPLLLLLAPPHSLLSSSLGPLPFQSQAHQENILQLQVSVADILTVHVGDGVGDLPPRSSFSIKSLASSDTKSN